MELFAVLLAVLPGAWLPIRLTAPSDLVPWLKYALVSNETYRLSHSALGWLFEQPYLESPPYLIARNNLDSPGTSANANFWADGIAHFGLLGLFAATLLLGVLLIAVDGVSSGKSLPVAAAALSASAFSLTNSALPHLGHDPWNWPYHPVAAPAFASSSRDWLPVWSERFEGRPAARWATGQVVE